jgi:2-keto-3-deoxy-galactonokinase
MSMQAVALVEWGTSNLRVWLVDAAANVLGERQSAEGMGRSEERRVGKECRRLCRSRWSPYH